MQHVATSITYKFPLRFLRKFNDVSHDFAHIITYSLLLNNIIL